MPRYTHILYKNCDQAIVAPDGDAWGYPGDAAGASTDEFWGDAIMGDALEEGMYPVVTIGKVVIVWRKDRDAPNAAVQLTFKGVGHAGDDRDVLFTQSERINKKGTGPENGGGDIAAKLQVLINERRMGNFGIRWKAKAALHEVSVRYHVRHYKKERAAAICHSRGYPPLP